MDVGPCRLLSSLGRILLPASLSSHVFYLGYSSQAGFTGVPQGSMLALREENMIHAL